MDDSRNATDITLLRSDPGKLVLRYQETIGIIVRTYVRSGMFHPAETDDIIQQITTELYEKLPRIRAQFNGTALVRTYLSSIIRHACLNLHKKRRSEPAFVDLDEASLPSEAGDPDRKLALEHSIRVLRAILAQFHADRPKLMICLKTMYRIPLTATEIRTWWPDGPEADVQALLALSRSVESGRTDKEVFAAIHPFITKAERSTSSHDSIRRWTDERIKQIISLLNGTPPTASHTKETVGILMEDLEAPFLLRQ